MQSKRQYTFILQMLNCNLFNFHLRVNTNSFLRLTKLVEIKIKAPFLNGILAPWSNYKILSFFETSATEYIIMLILKAVNYKRFLKKGSAPFFLHLKCIKMDVFSLHEIQNTILLKHHHSRWIFPHFHRIF